MPHAAVRDIFLSLMYLSYPRETGYGCSEFKSFFFLRRAKFTRFIIGFSLSPKLFQSGSSSRLLIPALIRNVCVVVAGALCARHDPHSSIRSELRSFCIEPALPGRGQSDPHRRGLPAVDMRPPPAPRQTLVSAYACGFCQNGRDLRIIFRLRRQDVPVFSPDESDPPF